MTRPIRAMKRCPRCGENISLETEFSKWVRTKLKDSRDGLAVSDFDFIFHRFKSHGTRTVQFIMNVEVKTFCGIVNDSQLDTIAMEHQISRTHNQNNRNASGRISGGTKKPPQVYSTILRKYVTLNHLGWYLLKMDGECPETSTELLWSHKPVSIEKLTQILQLDIHPFTFNPLSARRHKNESMTLFPDRRPEASA